MKKKKSRTKACGCYGFILYAAIIVLTVAGVCIITKLIAESDLPLWLKFVLLK